MILAPADADVTILDDDFKDEVIDKIIKLMASQTRAVVMKFLHSIDASINEEGIVVWPVDPADDILGWRFMINWEHLKDETFTFCSNFSCRCDVPYDADSMARMKKVRDGFAELVAIMDGEMSAGSPSEETVRHA